ncbi:MAG: hypothetical protein IJW19_01615 [Clostridia bacterium]|nr:hypothetical protein [Clostridia bacterium]
MKKILSIILILVILSLSLSVLSSCGSAEPEEGEITRMTVDINPSVEFIIDDQNRISSVTALNDDGSILIVGEAFVGKTPEEAIEMMVSLASETGYLVKGNVEAGENTVKISVSGDTDYAEQLKENAIKAAEDSLKELDIEGQVKQVEALGVEALRELALSTSLYTEEEINAMDEKQLYSVISQSRVETALLLTEDMRKAYYSAKEYEISFTKREETAKVIKSMGISYSIVHSAYKSALDVYSQAITDIEQFRYDMLISPDSQYQKSLNALRESKTELLKQKTFTASLNINGQEYASAVATLKLTEENYNNLLKAYETLGAQINASLEALIVNLKQAESYLIQLENTLFDDNIEAKLLEKAEDIEATLNSAKDKFYEDFEKAHANDITSIETQLLEKKNQLKSEIKA